MRVPVATPAGTLMVRERRLRMRPWPLHSLQGSLMTVPKPSQLPHGAVVMTWPRMERTARWTWPLPPQMSQRSGWLPGRQQEPSQVGQVTAVSTSSFLLTPKTASRSSIRTLISASWPRRTREAGPPWPPAPPKKVSKMSWNAKPWPA